MLLDQILLKQQGFRFVGRYCDLNVRDMTDHCHGFGIQSVAAKITGYAVFQLFGLATYSTSPSALSI